MDLRRRGIIVAAWYLAAFVICLIVLAAFGLSVIDTITVGPRGLVLAITVIETVMLVRRHHSSSRMIAGLGAYNVVCALVLAAPFAIATEAVFAGSLFVGIVLCAFCVPLVESLYLIQAVEAARRRGDAL